MSGGVAGARKMAYSGSCSGPDPGKDTRRVEVTLVAVKADGSQHEVVMKRARLVIGRKKECDIRIPVPSVSREHCEVRVESGKVIVRDLGSSNGTYINRERVQESELKPGQLIGVGPAVFVLRVDGKPAQIDARKASTQGAAPEPLAAASAPSKRPSSPGKGASKPGQEDPALDDSSVSDFDMDILDDDDEKKQPRL
jgi:pSer/pThr/pTyr-binding forkhead associated (FHA) protein